MTVRAEVTRLLDQVHEAHRSALAQVVLERWPQRPDRTYAATVDTLAGYRTSGRNADGLERWLGTGRPGSSTRGPST